MVLCNKAERDTKRHWVIIVLIGEMVFFCISEVSRPQKVSELSTGDLLAVLSKLAHGPR